MIKLLILMMFFASPVLADTYAVERVDGSVAIVHYFNASQDSLADVLESVGLTGRPIKSIDPHTDLPLDRADRNHWVLNDVPIGPKVKVDPVRKQAAEDAKTQALARRNTARNKICASCSDQDFIDALGE